MQPHYLKTREDLKKLEDHAQMLRERFPEEYAKIYAQEAINDSQDDDYRRDNPRP